MKLSHVLLLCLLVGFFALGAHASVIDPTNAIGDPACQEGDIQITASGAIQGLVVNNQGGGVFTYCNATGEEIIDITETTSNAPYHYTNDTGPTGVTTNVHCPFIPDPETGTVPFEFCDVSLSSDLSTIIIHAHGFSGDDDGDADDVGAVGFESGNFPGIPNGSELVFNLNDPTSSNNIQVNLSNPAGSPNFCTGPNCTGSWVAGTVLSPTVSTGVPEPASLLLLGTGLVGLATRLRKRR